ncbi:MAG: hypothetical protein JST10_02800 [Bacteroidetes bacterium]|nr:hypothetical protein [Bacteroidota bacterium]
MKTKLLFVVAFFFTLQCIGKPSIMTNTMLKELNPSNFKLDFSKYDKSTALFCSQMSDVAYLADGDFNRLQTSLDSLYGKKTILIKHINVQQSHTRAVICATKNFIVVAFRGTDFSVIKDVITDIKIDRYISRDDAEEHVHNIPPGHAGFRKGSIRLILDGKLIDSILLTMQFQSGSRNPKAIPIYTTGHSMGAGYASLFIKPFAAEFNYRGTYNFAPPLTISCDAASDIQNNFKDVIYDIVNYKDYVPRAGRYCRNHMHHVGKFYRISLEGKIYREDERYVRWTRDEFGFKSLKTYHEIAGYQNAVRSDENTNDKIDKREKNGEVIFGHSARVIQCW